jgi:hypothetical protein
MVCGRAMAAVMKIIASNLNKKGKCLMLVFQEVKPFAETSDMMIEPWRLLFFAAYHHINTGITISNSKNQGWPKIILLK